MLSLERLSAFVVFSEHLNFTHAARSLGISQPALHAQVSRLSDELGVPLYIRDGRSLRLTTEGEKVAAFGRDLTARVTTFAGNLRGENTVEPVTLAAGEGCFLYLLGPAIQATNHPLRLITADLAATIDALRSGRAAVGVASTDAAPAGLTLTPLTEIPLVALIPADHPLAGTGPLALSDLQDARLIVPPADRPHRQAVAGALARAGVRWEVAVEAGGWELMRRFVAMGMGLAIVNGFCPPPDGGCARPLPELPARRYVILRRPGEPSTAVASLIAALHTHAEDWRA
ncbi:MAG: DNA-binding transcriptional LysR family regulator [Myxococcota bacterium]|jgi:DNA-binding transcriptional LysR family regulator